MATTGCSRCLARLGAACRLRRWSDRDARRYLVALRNAPDVPDPRALSLRERQVAWCAALGQSNKLVAYHLGLALSTVAAQLSRAMKKLRVTTRAELIALVRRLASAAPPGGGPA